MFTIEKVESRLLMAASTVTAKLSSTGTLFISATDADETIYVTQSHGGGYAISVSGAALTLVDRNGLTSRIQQARYRPLYDLARVKRISISGLGGNDEIRVATEKSIPLNVRGGAGNDRITLANARSTVFGDAGDDIIHVAGQSLTYTSPVYVDRPAGWGDTPLLVSTSYPGIEKAKSVLNATGIRVDAGDGNDIVFTRGTEDSVYGGAGEDKVIKMNELDVFNSDLPALQSANGSNDAPSRLATFGVEAVVSLASAGDVGYYEISAIGAIAAPVVVRRNTIDALRA
jgi:Ca2+-binding RTX toxin-like protein